MKIKCKKCSYEIEDKWYKFYKNKEGLRESMLSHIELHEKNNKIKEYFGVKK